ncbi:MAG TPA: hypothetical protein VND80_00800 [Steroidobacteraceae bacterium]|nr:hypothetical protein [Steroidobacteraceae bacterium]
MIYSDVDRTGQAAERASAAEEPRKALLDDCTANFAGDIFDRVFDLLKRHLRVLTLEWRGGSQPSSDHADLQAMSARIHECAAALDHMHAALGPDIARLRQTERELHLTRNAYGRAQAELAASRSAGDRRIGLGDPGP